MVAQPVTTDGQCTVAPVIVTCYHSLHDALTASHVLPSSCCITLSMEKQHGSKLPMAGCPGQKAVLELIGGMWAVQ